MSNVLKANVSICSFQVEPKDQDNFIHTKAYKVWMQPLKLETISKELHYNIKTKMKIVQGTEMSPELQQNHNHFMRPLDGDVASAISKQSSVPACKHK